MPYKDPEKQKQAQHEHYLKNIDTYKKATKLSREKRNELVQSIKNDTPCADCGQSFPYYVMDFDHRNPDEKFKEVGYLQRHAGTQRILDEIAKCDVVCANCHRIRTHERRVRIGT